MRNLPIPFLNSFCPTPKTTLSDGCRFAGPKILVQIKAVASDAIDHKSHFVLVARRAFSSLDLGDKIRRRNLGLTHSHMAHLWAFKVHAVANGVGSFMANDTHRPVDIDVALDACDPYV